MNSEPVRPRLWPTFTSLTFTLGIIWACGYWFSDSRLSLLLYRHTYVFNSGQRLAEQLSLAGADESHSCVIIGPSSGRQGLLTEIINEAVQGIKFFNGSGAGASYQMQESQAAVMRRYKIYPYCVIVVINPWIMIGDPTPLESDGLLGFLSYSDIVDFGLKPLENPQNSTLRREVWLNTVMPQRRHSIQIGRIVRESIYHVHETLYKPNALQLTAFSTNQYELVKSERFRIYGTFSPKERSEQLHRNRHDMNSKYFKTNNYGDPKLDKPLINTLEILEKLTTKLFVVRAPEATFLDVPNSYVAPYHNSLLSHFPPEVVYIDMSRLLKDNQFDGYVHANPEGRVVFSRELGKQIAAHITTESK